LQGAQDALARILPEHVADGASLLVIWYDVENLGIVNDSLGTDAGDAFLQAIAERVRGLIDPGEIAARVASNFVIILRGPTATRERCEAGLAVLSRRYQIAAREIFTSPAVGYCLYDDPAVRAPELFRRAHSAMRRARHGGGARIKAYSTRRDTGAAHMETLALLHHAADAGDFELFYQPIIALTDGAMTGAEALLRWNAGGKILEPADFFSALERSELMDRVGLWAIGEAIAQAGRWHGAGHTIDVWINVAARLLVDPAFATNVIALIDASQSDARHIVIEVTERDAMHDLEKMSAIFSQLRARGLRIAIDDFGVGESSLARLRDVEVDILKIDGSFVTGIPGDVRALNIVRNVVSMANTLGLRTVAEWIEQPEQAVAVREIGADLGQGFYLGRPAPADDLFAVGPRVG
jgi:EAL domain-containing protein (putative c-di-GMP-specific phosphodiesterase class I)/GGDEF domain-containing protein